MAIDDWNGYSHWLNVSNKEGGRSGVTHQEGSMKLSSERMTVGKRLPKMRLGVKYANKIEA